MNTNDRFDSDVERQSGLSAQEVLRQVHEELRQLLKQRAEIMRRIGTAKKTIAGLAALFGDGVLSADLHQLVHGGSGDRKSGFTRTCRTILMEADHPLSAREVRDRMQERVPGLLERQKDPISSITTILNRLVDYGEVQRVTLADHTRGWQWVADLGSSPSEQLRASYGRPRRT